ncbi:MAG: SRPBCC family protein [Alphaproteobacteria bacterium]|nr:SRPBCC family protein [Alphaproteobacteria bacterium]
MSPASPSPAPLDPSLDLRLERVVPVPVELVWRAWTEAELLTKWFCPAPWTTPEAILDVRPGGRFYTVMQGPEEGQRMESEGCYLDVVPNRRLIWTDALAGGYRPNGGGFFTGELHLEAVEGGTRYVAIARHGNPDACRQHAEMGFLDGWGAALDQLVALMSGD